MAEYQAWMEETIEKIEKKMAWVSEKSRNKIPYTTLNGVHDDKSDSGNYRIRRTGMENQSNQELICKGWFLPPNTYDCGSFVVN